MSIGYMAKCAWKRQHESEIKAERHRGHLVRTTNTYTWKNSNTYQCNVCGFWHVGRIGTVNRGSKGKGRR
jgi:hypothetical protein